MRLLAGLAIAFGFGAATGVAAQSAPTISEPSRLMGAAFAPDYAPRAGAADDFSKLIDREQVRPDGAPVRWRTNELKLGQTRSGAVDSVRVSVGGALRSPSGLPQNLDSRTAAFDADAYEIAVTRDWAPVRFDAGDLDVNLTPHTGVGVSSAGGQAEAGAVLTVGQKRDDVAVDRLKDLGVRDGAAYGDRGRWYFFAAASGRAVGLNVQRTNGDWGARGLSTDTSSALINDIQAGVGWRKGSVQASLAWMRRKVKAAHTLMGWDHRDDSMVAVTMSIKPRR